MTSFEEWLKNDTERLSRKLSSFDPQTIDRNLFIGRKNRDRDIKRIDNILGNKTNHVQMGKFKLGTLVRTVQDWTIKETQAKGAEGIVVGYMQSSNITYAIVLFFRNRKAEHEDWPHGGFEDYFFEEV